MPAAAAVPPRKIGGMAQKTLITDRCPTCDSAKLRTMISTLSWKVDGENQADRRGQRAERDVDFAFAGAIGVAADQDHADQRGGERDCGDRAQLESVEPRRVAQDLRQPQEHAVGHQRVQEIDHAEQQHLRTQHAASGCMAALMLRALGALARHRVARATRDRPPGATVACSGRSVRNHSAITPSTTAGRPSTRNSHCQPARPITPFKPEQRFGQRARRRSSRSARPIMNSAPARARSLDGNPVGEVQHHAREESGFGDAEQTRAA